MVTVPTSYTAEAPVANSPAPNVYADPGAANAVFAQTTSDNLRYAGNKIEGASDALTQDVLRTRMQDNERMAKQLYLDYSTGLRKIQYGDGTPENPGYYSLQGQNAIDAFGNTSSSVKKLQQDLANKAQNPKVAEMFNQAATAAGDGALADISRHNMQQTKAANAATADAVVADAAANAAAAWNDPSKFTVQLQVARNQVMDQAHIEGWSPETTTQKLHEVDGSFAAMTVKAALANGGSKAGEALFQRYSGIIPEPVQDDLLKDIKVQQHAEQAEADHQMALADHYRSQAQEKAFSDAAGKIIANDPSVTPLTIAHDPTLTGPAKFTLWNALKQADKGDPLPVVSQKTLVNLMSGLTKPEGDPKKITTMDPAYAAFNAGDLSKADFKFFNEQYNEQLTATGRSLLTSTNKLIQDMEPSLTKFTFAGLPYDKQGVYNYTMFVQQEIDAAKAKGVNPYELLNPSSPKFLGAPGILKLFQTDMTTAIQNQLSAIGAGLLAQGAGANQITTTPAPVGTAPTGTSRDITTPTASTPASAPAVPLGEHPGDATVLKTPIVSSKGMTLKTVADVKAAYAAKDITREQATKALKESGVIQ